MGKAVFAVFVGIGFEVAMDVGGRPRRFGDLPQAGELGGIVLLVPREVFEVEGALEDRLRNRPIGILDQMGDQQLQGVAIIVFQLVFHVLISHLRTV